MQTVTAVQRLRLTKFWLHISWPGKLAAKGSHALQHPALIAHRCGQFTHLPTLSTSPSTKAIIPKQARIPPRPPPCIRSIRLHILPGTMPLLAYFSSKTVHFWHSAPQPPVRSRSLSHPACSARYQARQSTACRIAKVTGLRLVAAARKFYPRDKRKDPAAAGKSLPNPTTHRAALACPLGTCADRRVKCMHPRSSAVRPETRVKVETQGSSRIGVIHHVFPL